MKMRVTMTDDLIRDVLTRTRVIALVGFSHRPERASHSVGRFLVRQGYRVLPVNPGLAGQEFLGEAVAGSLADVAAEVDMVEIFRRSEDVPPVVEAALERWPNLPTIWMQLGIWNAEARAMAEARDVTVIENRCPAIEIPRLGLMRPSV